MAAFLPNTVEMGWAVDAVCLAVVAVATARFVCSASNITRV
jgi:hypothetical protein